MGIIFSTIFFRKFQWSFNDIVMKTDLPEMEKKVILKRYVDEVNKSDFLSSLICTIYYLLRFAISIGGVLLTSLLLLTKALCSDDTASVVLFWICWAIALLIGIANETVYAFGIDKKFFINTLIFEKLKSEGWLYLELAGRYKKYRTHLEGYKEFVYRIEKLKIANVVHNLEMSEHDVHDKGDGIMKKDSILGLIQESEEGKEKGGVIVEMIEIKEPTSSGISKEGSETP